MKNYDIIKENLLEDNLISSKKLTELGYSRYDINQFIENGILKREKWGIYSFQVKEEIEEKSTDTNLNLQEEIKLSQQIITLIRRREYIAARELCDSILENNPTNIRIKLSKFATYIFEEDYTSAENALVDIYNTNGNEEILYNIYIYFKLLSKLTVINKKIKDEVSKKLQKLNGVIWTPRIGSNLYKAEKAIDQEDYEEALKNIGYVLHRDKKTNSYRITNVMYMNLVKSIMLLKQQEQQKEEEKTKVIIPKIETEIIVKQNLFQEAINNNNYALALTLLKSEDVENPIEIIESLLQRLSGIQLLINSTNPILIIEEEEVEVEEEVELEQTTSFEEVEQQTKNYQTTQIFNAEIVVEQERVKEIESKESIDELIGITYKEYKKAFEKEDFEQALKYINRYEYLCNSNSSQRSVNYHHIRIENCKKEYNENPERYLKKKILLSQIFELERNRNFDEALIAIEAYKSLGGFIEPRVLIIEARIAHETEDIIKLNSIIESLEGCEEPDYFSLKGKNCYRRHRYQEALIAYQQFNERRPNSSARTYKMIGECYSKLRKRGKAIKAFSKADEINKRNNIDIDLSKRIEYEKMLSEGIIEEKNGLIFAKK